MADGRSFKHFAAVRSRRLIVRITPEEERRIEERAALLRQSVAEYVRRCLFDSKRPGEP